MSDMYFQTFLNLHKASCHPEHREGSDELLSVAKKSASLCIQILHFVQNDKIKKQKREGEIKKHLHVFLKNSSATLPPLFFNN